MEAVCCAATRHPDRRNALHVCWMGGALPSASPLGRADPWRAWVALHLQGSAARAGVRV